MPYYQFTQKQVIHSTIEKVWEFISSPHNLKTITPDYMGFEVLSNSHSDKMYEGMIITYKVSPVLGIKLNWMTEITHVKELEYFVDEQRIGPYKLWHHQHKIESIANDVLMTDIVTYVPPLGFLGAIANSIFIKKQLKEIFNYRNRAIDKIFAT